MAEALRDNPYVSPESVGKALNSITGKDEREGLCESDFAFHKPAHPRPLTRPVSASSACETTIEHTRMRVPCCMTETTEWKPVKRPQSATVVTRTISATSLNRPVHDSRQRPFSAGPQRFVVTSVSKPLGTQADRKEYQLLSDMAVSRPIEKKQRPASSPGKPRWQTWKMCTYTCDELRRKTVKTSQSNASRSWQLNAHSNKVLRKLDDASMTTLPLSKMEDRPLLMSDTQASNKTFKRGSSLVAKALTFSRLESFKKLEDA